MINAVPAMMLTRLKSTLAAGRCPGPAQLGALLLFCFCCVEPSLAQDRSDGELLPLPERMLEFVRTYQALFGGTLGAALGYLAKWYFDQLNAERTARREFAQSVTTQISELANEYYWSLANYAGVLAGLLESYLDNRTQHLMLLWEDRSQLATRLDQISNEFSQMSFYHFCRLIGLFDVFQFQGGNTYLLTNHAAGEKCKQLYNMFIANLPLEDNEDSIDTLKIVKVLRELRTSESHESQIPVAELPSAEFMSTIAQNELKTEFENYRKWVQSRTPNVEEAADALRAYNELLNHELARLYGDFFKKTPPGSNLYLGEVAFDEWPHLLTEQSYAAMERASVQGTLLRPLGTPVTAGETVPKDKPTTTDTTDDGTGEAGDHGERKDKLVRQHRESQLVTVDQPASNDEGA